MLKGFDDADSEIGLSANSAILMGPDSAAEYVEPASSAFESQQNFITELENQMRNLGISTLFAQTFVAETSEAKAMDRSDSDSMLSVVSQDLQNALQNAIDMAAAFVGIEAPKVCVSRDFDLQKLDGTQVGQYMQMWQNGAITHQTLLEILSRGEILPDIDIESEIEMLESNKLAGLDLQAAGGIPKRKGEDEETENSDSSGEQDSEVRQEVLRRLRATVDENSEEEDE